MSDRALLVEQIADGTAHRAGKVRGQPETDGSSELGWDASVTPEGPFYWGSCHH